ncbi:SDR family oxidoreductase [Arenibacter sp. BSSL-BM3]|uniref:SDR family oxidoreductase n=1 Tax=Arenibacter arenosicollis TaxID=2762274 RepID=A0ABR7QRM5_9FLAO|nr:SDR family oxidoreductase [Arenibacter arenosicollis]MBC8769836.1 SDR family oxidoreductase [Arenibacter arenosicollis]
MKNLTQFNLNDLVSKKEYVLIIGAKSDVAMAVARKYAKEGFNLYLASRNSDTLEEFASDLKLRYECHAQCLELDILDYSSHQFFYDQLKEEVIGVISAVGYLGDQKISEKEFMEASKLIDTNFTGIVSLFNIIALDFEQRKSGFICGISSVAGDRGRKKNYIYGAAKAALSTYLSGLRNRLFSSGVHVITVKPGFIATKMTEGLDLPKRLTGTPEQVASDIYNAQKKLTNVVYTIWIWRWIMLIIRNIPEWQFKKMNI